MSDYFIYYASANMVGAVVFGIMLIHDCLGVDRQEKQIKYDQALIAFMLYFISDVIWVGFDYNQEAFSKCMRRADEKLYTDKENCKKNGKSTICK